MESMDRIEKIGDIKGKLNKLLKNASKENKRQIDNVKEALENQIKELVDITTAEDINKTEDICKTLEFQKDRLNDEKLENIKLEEIKNGLDEVVKEIKDVWK
ncbi:31469_t:CDS:2 [Gigaspora margarita]|uniref:31469_t:CDS:1 n=1 Tax=Gigaspora margarita TaxID=4874 RepID=A0ABN7UGM0_GIGMA|nr:31469_t:CDS:2 [Gigaspora margarita]